MSSFDPAPHAVRTGEGFTPLAPRAESDVPLAATVFRDLNRPAAAEPALEPEPASEGTSELEALREAAYREGFAAARAGFEQELAAGAQAFAGAVEEVARFRSGLLERYHRELLDLALEVARKVVQRELDEHPEHWLQMIRDGVQRSLDREVIRIRVGAILHRYLVANLAQLRARLDDVKELDLIEDTSLAETGCVIEAASCQIDLGIDSQIGAIRMALQGTE